MAKPDFPQWARTTPGNIAVPPRVKQNKGWNAKEPAGAQFLNWHMNAVGLWIQGLQNNFVNIIIGTQDQVDDDEATHTIGTFVAAIDSGDRIAVLAGAAHTLARNEDITDQEIEMVFEPGASIAAGGFTFTFSGIRSIVKPGRWTGFADDGIIVSGAGSRVEAIGTNLEKFLVTNNATVHTTGDGAGAGAGGGSKGGDAMPIGTIIARVGTFSTANNKGVYSETELPPVPPNWRICDGEVISDAASPMNGRFVPEMNDNRFLRGSASTGVGRSTSNAHTHTMKNHTHLMANHVHTITHTHPIAHTHTNPTTSAESAIISLAVSAGPTGLALAHTHTQGITGGSSAANSGGSSAPNTGGNNVATAAPNDNVSDGPSDSNNEPSFLNCTFYQRIK